MWRRHHKRHTPNVDDGTFHPVGVAVKFGNATQSLVDWMVRHAAADTLTVDGSAWEYVTKTGHHCAIGDWLVGQEVPEGWLRLQAGKEADEVVFATWADGLMHVSDRELPILGRMVNALQRLTDAGIPWGAAAAHVLLMLADVAAPDGMDG